MASSLITSHPAVGSRKDLTNRQNLLLVLPFIIFFLVQLVHHQMWRDELNAWGIVVASPNPTVLYQHIRYEGHPSLWYILLWIPSRFTASPSAMKCVEGLIGVAIYLMLALRSPFSRLEKLLLYAGYFISFEYTVMSRMYGLCLLLILIYAYRRSRYPHEFEKNIALLALIANTDVSGVILSGGLLAEYALSNFPAWKKGEIPARRVAGSAAIYSFGLICAWLALRISPHISWRTTGRMFVWATSFRHLVQTVVSYIAVPWFPIAEGFPHHFWDPWLYWPQEHERLLLMCVVTILLYAWIFRRDWKIASILLLVSIGAIGFAHLVYLGGTRHYGITFMAFLAALWLQRYRRPQRSFPVLLLLFLGAVGGVQAAIAQWDHPFSQGSAVVTWLHTHGLDKAPLIGTPDTSVAGIAEQMQRPIYFLDCNCVDTFLLFSNRRDDFDARQIPQRLVLASEKLNTREMIFLTTYSLPPEQLQQIRGVGFDIHLLVSFTGAEDWEENYYIYQVNRR